MKRETIGKKRLSDIPVFWQLLIIMLLVLSTVFIQQIISNRMYEKKLIRDYIQIETKHLEQSSDALFSQIYNAYAIPRAIEDTAGFRYIRAFSGNELPAKYSSVLSMLQSAFRNQIYLRQDSCDGMIYLSRLNVICTNSKVFFHSEDCLGSYLLFEKTDSEEIVSYLEQRGSVKVLIVVATLPILVAM